MVKDAVNNAPHLGIINNDVAKAYIDVFRAPDTKTYRRPENFWDLPYGKAYDIQLKKAIADFNREGPIDVYDKRNSRLVLEF